MLVSNDVLGIDNVFQPVLGSLWLVGVLQRRENLPLTPPEVGNTSLPFSFLFIH